MNSPIPAPRRASGSITVPTPESPEILESNNAEIVVRAIPANNERTRAETVGQLTADWHE